MSYSCKFGFFGGNFLERVNTRTKFDVEVTSLEKNLESNQKEIVDFTCRENKIFTLRQIHSNKIFILNDEKDLEKSGEVEADCVMTHLPEVFIGVKTADCAPILFWDQENGIVAACHAGWRGTLSGIVENVSELFKNYYGSDTRDVKIFIGPMIRCDSYKVSEDFFEKWISNDEDFGKFFYRKNKNYHFDLAGVLKDKLNRRGFDENNISDCGTDTFTDFDYYSYRRLFLKNKFVEDKFDRNVSVIKNSSRYSLM